MGFELQELELIPPALKELIMTECDDISTIKHVIVGAYMLDMDNHVGTYIPETQVLLLDMGNALSNTALYNRGMMFIPNVWYTLLWALGHEIQHALQLEAEPGLLSYEKLPQEYEDGAMAHAEDLVIRWSYNNNIPSLDMMGWLGKQLITMLNAAYTQYPDLSDEPALHEQGAVATLESVIALHEFTDKSKELLIEAIDRGEMGVKIGESRYLTAYEFLGL